MKIKFTKNDFTENGGKLFLTYLDILNQWESDSVGKTLKFNPSRRIIRIIYTLAEKIAKKLLIDHGFNDSEWSQQKHTLQSAGKQIRKLFISKQSAKKNFEIDIEFDTDTGDIKIIEKISNKEFEQKPVDEQKESEPIKESDLEGVDIVNTDAIFFRQIRVACRISFDQFSVFIYVIQVIDWSEIENWPKSEKS